MEELRITIKKHGVENSENGLSYMQNEIINRKENFLIVSAPTGSGKSFAFIKEVQNNKKILFIMPTKRLGQNLLSSTKKELSDQGYSKEKIERTIELFTSEEAEKLKKQNVLNMSSYRIRQILRKKIIFSTPEALNSIFLNFKGFGNKDFGPQPLLRYYDYIVFDEYHLYTERSFGIIGMLIKFNNHLQNLYKEKNITIKTSKIVLLSATPINIGHLLKDIGVEITNNNLISEKIVETKDNVRILHGDVKITFIESKSVFEVLKEKKILLLDNIKNEMKTVFLYDSLKKTLEEKELFYSLSKELNINPIFFDNSIDNQIKKEKQNFEEELVISATSTLEVGVTLSNLKTLFMEPGYNILSFIQRIGRVARGNIDGEVFVVYNKNTLSKSLWLSELIEFCKNIKEKMNIIEFNKKLIEINKGFLDKNLIEEIDNDIILYYKNLRKDITNNNVGLYYYLLLGTSIDENQKKELIKSAPKSFFNIKNKIYHYSKGKKDKWIELFILNAKNFRNFPPTINLIKEDGSKIVVSESWITLYTDILERYPFDLENNCIYLDNYEDISKCLKNDNNKKYTRTALLSNIKRSTIEIGNFDIPQTVYLESQNNIIKGLLSKKEYQNKASIARDLVGFTGVIPYELEHENVMGKNSVIL
jgi:CRISPR-associated endonuclease/helicase Cas3